MRRQTLGDISYETRTARLLEQYAALAPGAPVRLAKRTSNLFRPRAAATVPGLDVASFDGVLSVDPAARTADVQGMTTYEHLVDATLPHGLMPFVVPQLKTITLGGAVTGLGIESSSFRNGLPHESVLEMDVLTGDGRIVTARRDNEHRDLFFGFPNSYGTLGYALRLTIELQPVRPFVQLAHRRYVDADTFFAAMADIVATGSHEGDPADFLDGTVFGADEMYLSVGRFVDTVPYTSDYTGMDIYYRSIQARRTDHLTVRDYLWRWDTDWFWCSQALQVQRPAVRRLVPKRYLGSQAYQQVVGFERRHGWAAQVDRWRGRPEREPVIQDVEIPIERSAEFLDFFRREIGISPVWTCPLRQRDPGDHWDLYAFDPAAGYVNFGFWSSVPLRGGEAEGHYNRLIEAEVERLGGRKSLYSTSFYDKDDFWRIYNGTAYDVLKKTYDPEGRLLDLYDKCVLRR